MTRSSFFLYQKISVVMLNGSRRDLLSGDETSEASPFGMLRLK